VELEFTDDAIAEIASSAALINNEVANIGARRLHTIMTSLLDDIMFDIPEIINNKFGKAPYILTAIISIIALFIAAAVQITATSTIISASTGLNIRMSIVISGAVITIYTLTGGLISVAATDIIHIIS